MKPYRLAFWLLIMPALLATSFAAAAAAQAAPAPDWTPTEPSNDPVTRKGFDDFYNLEYDKAIHQFEEAIKAHPDDPFAVNHLLSAVVFKELLRIGALDTEAYATDSFVLKKPIVPLDPAVKVRVKQLSDQALALSQVRLSKNGNDVNALYARGVTKALNSTYHGMAEKAWLASLRSGLGAREDHERVLELDPNYTDAKTIVGIHLYIIGSLSWPVKVAASAVGLGGSKSKGLQYLREAAAANGETAMDARIALALFLRREQKYNEAIQVVGQMQTLYPHNFLIASEYANLLNAAGHGQEAIAAYRKVLAGCHNKSFAVCNIDVPAYGLGEALKGQRQYQEAAEAYEMATQTARDPELKQKAMLGAGEMYDVLHKRDDAIGKYKAVIAQNSDSGTADLARQYLKQPYSTP